MITATPVPRPRPTWREPRFLLGLLLVVVSVVGVAGLVAVSDRSVRAFAARHVLVAGDELTTDDVVPVRVRLGQTGAAYLMSAPRSGAVVTRTVARGELIPLSAVGEASAQTETSVVVALGGALPGAVDAGATVDVWAAAPSAQNGGSLRFDAPSVRVSAATVVRVLRDSGLGAGDAVSVELRVPNDSAAELIEAVTNDFAITLVPHRLSVGE
ncbi:hypothetical protein ACFOYW_17905 [Gryllotalpicola reticulitermitis]|uniref:SAF domain-containing protein n=1 Tax=Gryllotalpicola reticulitermitis TaxID=1184153 RepID=A0ABV8QC23_9MICO